ncbi:unnamed protein product [Rotaria sp. Silwood1]|nr:unnamed protein product [Rotaria sp. Silwood1]CAF3552734.1 unnamed protein product [Rotaria sp. Silwood1]CAF4668820.1 unnamed protein product [Rotaria sp. Silwood1]CAF4826627.1 unnamed protein product [Rotaria sp. Silwood1]
MTEQEEKNIRLVKEYMQISYDSERSSSKNVAHLVASDNKFIAPTTFLNTHSCQAYADEHGIIEIDYLIAKDDQVALCYSTEGRIPAIGRKAKWTAAALYKFNSEGKITLFIKEWDKLLMWKQLGFPLEEATKIPST